MRPPCRHCGRTVYGRRHVAIELCEHCATSIGDEVQARVRSMQQAFAILANGAALPAKLEQCDRILQEAEALSRYEALGILTTAPPPSILLTDFHAKRQAVERTISGAGEALQSREKQNSH